MMKVEEINSHKDAERYAEGLINDFELAISTKEETMEALGEYTARLMDIFWEGAKREIKKDPSLLALKKVPDDIIPKNKDKKLFRLPEPMIELLRDHGTVVQAGDAAYFNLPYWYKTSDKGLFEILHPEELPMEVIKILADQKGYEENE